MNNSNSSTTLIVGAGFAGSCVARVLADAGRRVHVIEKKNHIAGNAYDELDAHGVLVHRYGPHIFHTNSQRIADFLSRFTRWKPYEHRVMSIVHGHAYPFPINRTTLNNLYGLELDELGAADFLASVRHHIVDASNSRDIVLNAVGEDLYEKFFHGYTRKQWGIEPEALKASVAARIPVRTNDDDRYFTDTFQQMPADGYTSMFHRMLDHPLILISLSTAFEQTMRSDYAHVIYTGPIDAFYDYRFGALPYRSLRFEHQHFAQIPRYQACGTINFPNDHAYTRITEFKHLTGQAHPGTSVVFEYPCGEGDPYYPIPNADNEALFKRYEALSLTEANVTFVGRLAQYRYYNMDQVVGAALTAAKRLLEQG